MLDSNQAEKILFQLKVKVGCDSCTRVFAWGDLSKTSYSLGWAQIYIICLAIKYLVHLNVYLAFLCMWFCPFLRYFSFYFIYYWLDYYSNRNWIHGQRTIQKKMFKDKHIFLNIIQNKSQRVHLKHDLEFLVIIKLFSNSNAVFMSVNSSVALQHAYKIRFAVR